MAKGRAAYTKEMDQRLLGFARRFPRMKWDLVEPHFPGFTRIQLCHRLRLLQGKTGAAERLNVPGVAPPLRPWPDMGGARFQDDPRAVLNRCL